ncbi:MAG TPA: hypothetical protein VKG20_20635 [Methylomirabilota bacterium]|nr:hypothetical protein [Methylomirabilota bacterium]
MLEFSARLITVRSTPSRSEDADTATRLVFEAHDITTDWLTMHLGQSLQLAIDTGPPPRLPLDDALAEADGHVAVPGAGRRRRGTVAEPVG